MKQLRRLCVILMVLALITGSCGRAYASAPAATVTSGSSVTITPKPAEQKVKPKPKPVPKLPLDKSFAYFKEMKPGEVSLYVKDLRTGGVYSIHGDYLNAQKDAGMVGASTIKIFMGYHIIQEINKGNLSWTKVYTDPVDKRKFTISKELRKMIVDSNNGSYNTFVRFLTPKAVNEGLQSYGLVHTKIYAEIGPASNWSLEKMRERYGTTKSSRINAQESAILMEKIHLARNEKNMKVLHSYMFLVKNRERLPKALGDAYKVAHKTGTIEGKAGVYNDIGIVYGKKGNYIVCILTAKQDKTVNAKIRSAVRSAVKVLDSMKI